MLATKLLLICCLFYSQHGSICVSQDVDEMCSEQNEYYSRCLGHCERRCDNFSPYCNRRICIPGCVCYMGYYRHPITRECVTKTECFEGSARAPTLTPTLPPTPPPTPPTPPTTPPPTPSPTVSPPQQCGINETYNSCGTACPLTCENYMFGTGQCIAVCVPGCFCNVGFVRNTNTGRCVKPSLCPRDLRDTMQPV